MFVKRCNSSQHEASQPTPALKPSLTAASASARTSNASQIVATSAADLPLRSLLRSPRLSLGGPDPDFLASPSSSLPVSSSNWRVGSAVGCHGLAGWVPRRVGACWGVHQEQQHMGIRTES